MEAIIIKPNEENVEVIERDKPFELEELQELVGGYIEVVPQWTWRDGHKLMVVNEEGLIKDLPYNVKATDLLKHFNPYGIRGTAVLMDVGLME